MRPGEEKLLKALPLLANSLCSCHPPLRGETFLRPPGQEKLQGGVNMRHLITKTTFAAHLKTLEETGWVYKGGQFPESGSDQEVFSLAKLFKGQYVIMSLDTMTLLVNTAIPNIINIFFFKIQDGTA